MIGIIIVCCLLFSLNVAAQDQDSIASVSLQDSTKTTFMDRIHQLQQFLDDKAKKKVDPRYIEVPEKPWRVILRYKANMVNVDYDNSIDFPATLVSIGEYAFQYCNSLTSVVLPDNLTTLGKNAFAGCDALTSVTIPGSVKTRNWRLRYGSVQYM